MTNEVIQIRDVFAEVTRYPVDVLDLNANLEEDLGIDSVKLGEVFSVLRERFDLPADMHLPKEQLTTIAGVAQALGALLADRSQRASSAPPESTTASKFSLRLWLTITELGEPSTLTTVPFSTFSGRGKSGVSLLDSAWMGKETNKFATIGLVVMAINRASLIITLSCCCCHIYP